MSGLDSWRPGGDPDRYVCQLSFGFNYCTFHISVLSEIYVHTLYSIEYKRSRTVHPNAHRKLSDQSAHINPHRMFLIVSPRFRNVCNTAVPPIPSAL